MAKITKMKKIWRSFKTKYYDAAQVKISSDIRIQCDDFESFVIPHLQHL